MVNEEMTKLFYKDSETGQHVSQLKSPHTSDLKAAEEPKEFLLSRCLTRGVLSG